MSVFIIRFHGKHDGETRQTTEFHGKHYRKYYKVLNMLNQFEEGFLLGILIGEGHFGGDGKQAQITLRMHVRHRKLFFWLLELFPKSKLYGPYLHGGRNYYQWMARGVVLKNELLPIIMKNFSFFDEHIQSRINEMCLKYSLINEPIISSKT